MPIFMNCPKCNRPGNLPDSFRGGRVTCPGCGTITVIPAAKSATPPETAGPPKPMARPARPPQPKPEPSYLDDLDDEDDEPLVAPAPSRPSASRGRPVEAPKSNLPILLGVGGGAALLVAVVVVIIVVNRPSGEAPTVPDRVLAANANQQQVEPQPQAPVVSPAVRGYQAAPSGPAESSAETIRRVKDATVYVKVTDGKMRGTGTGFVIRSDGDSVLIATNRHVISHDEADDEEGGGKAPASPGAARPAPTITVVFRSGEGPGQEQEVPVVVLAKDSSGDPSRDLAILSAKGVNRPPKPIELSRAGVPSEGMDLRIYGFPFGQSLNLTNRGNNPAITVNKAAVSSLRRDARGQLSLIQVDGSVHPGNSGGPIVDDRGQLIGVTVAKLSIADNFGFAIPAANLDAILNGWIGSFQIDRVAGSSGGVEFQVSVELVDPMAKLRAVNVMIAPLTGPLPKASDGGLAAGPLPGATPYPLAISQPTKTASARIAPVLAGPPAVVLVQVSFTGGDGKNYLTPPRPYKLAGAPGRLVAIGERNTDAADKFRKKVLGKLGPLVDPDKDCQMARDDKSIKITIPGKLHTLAPQIVDKKKQAVKNAPMTLAQVDGDFLVHVRVAGEMRPGTDSVLHPGTGRSLPITFHGAGIVLWQDKDNYIRLERTCGTAGGPTLVTRLLVEVCKNGREAGRPYYIDVPEGPMSLLMVRKNGAIRCLFGNDGKKWAVLQELAAEFPAKVQVGLLGVNISKKPFTAQFEDFVLVDDKDKIDEELKDQ